MQPSGSALCLASGVASGAMAVFGKLAYDAGATVGTVLAVRFTLAALVLWGLVAGARRLRGVGRRTIATGLGLGAGVYALQAGCYFAALDRIDASLLSLVVYTFPAIVAVAAVGLGRERIDARRAGAIALVFAGLALVLAGAGAATPDPLGVGLAVATAVVYSAYVLVSDGLAGRIEPVALAALICTGAAVPLGLGAALLGDLRPGDVTPGGWGWLACLSLVSTVAAIALLLAGMRRVGPTTASILVTVEPVVTVVLACSLFGETLAPVQLAGGALVVVAVVQAQRSTMKRSVSSASRRTATWTCASTWAIDTPIIPSTTSPPAVISAAPANRS